MSNVDENGHIPQTELDNWKVPGLNNYRQNKQPGGEFGAPDAIVTLAPRCSGAYGLLAIVRNVGQAVLPPGQTVTFYSGNIPSGTELGKVNTTQALFPAQSETVFLPLPSALEAIIELRAFRSIRKLGQSPDLVRSRRSSEMIETLRFSSIGSNCDRSAACFRASGDERNRCSDIRYRGTLPR